MEKPLIVMIFKLLRFNYKNSQNYLNDRLKR